MTTLPPAVFLDRDGTMIHDPGYLSRLEELHWYPWTIDALRLLNRAGFLVFVVTNQGGVGLGLFDERFVHLVHDTMTARLAESGARVDGWFYCLHHPRAVVEELRQECECRKPKAGLIRQAQGQCQFDLRRSFVVGDKLSDIGMAAAVDVPGILVRTGHGAEDLERLPESGLTPALIADNLMDATAWILARSGFPREAD
jgi:D-glycero-D-manno-heptose 1,7-bisphosphate phosphatase